MLKIFKTHFIQLLTWLLIFIFSIVVATWLKALIHKLNYVRFKLFNKLAALECVWLDNLCMMLENGGISKHIQIYDTIKQMH